MIIPLENWKDPGGNIAQSGYLHSFRDENYYISGRGGGKTKAAVAKAVITAIYVNPGATGYITEQTYSDIEDILEPVWFDTVPRELYVWKASRKTAVFHNGSQVKFRPRFSSNSKRDPFRGPTVGWIIHDEIAMDKTRKVWELSMAMLRDPKARVKFVDGITTPAMGWLHKHMTDRGVGSDANPSTVGSMVTDDGYRETYGAFYGSTLQNEQGGKQLFNRLINTLSEDMAQQELFAKWISLAARAWKDADLENPWPQGNIYHHGFDPDMGYILAGDLGVQSSWLIIQRLMSPQNYYVDVVCGEFTPNEGGTGDDVRRVIDAYGIPTKVIIGADVMTRNVATGTAPLKELRDADISCQIIPITGMQADKSIQYSIASGLIKNARGERRLCLGHKFQSHDTRNRGLREVLLQDTWAEDAPKRGEFLPKDKSTRGNAALEDTRDAMMYYASGQYFHQSRNIIKAA